MRCLSDSVNPSAGKVSNDEPPPEIRQITKSSAVKPLVSADYARDTRSAIVDALSTMVTDGTLLKVYAWYDNEMGYATRMVDLACHIGSAGL